MRNVRIAPNEIEAWIDVVPKKRTGELLDTIWLACNALVGARIFTNNILGGNAATEQVRKLDKEFAECAWRKRLGAVS